MLAWGAGGAAVAAWDDCAELALGRATGAGAVAVALGVACGVGPALLATDGRGVGVAVGIDWIGTAPLGLGLGVALGVALGVGLGCVESGPGGRLKLPSGPSVSCASAGIAPAPSTNTSMAAIADRITP